MKKLLYAVSLLLAVNLPAFANPPSTFTEAKVVAKQKIYLDQASSAMGDLYCGCKWTWV
ncbi:deoxyribonuclease I, partial [Pseudomonas capeferrum]|nr:deoxyribonuclease I [Pseudomonas capeferrum]